jgi:multidrug efflux pump subunit AcrA (membrane-fusion protein)
MHPKLRNGEILPAGTVLLRFDPIDYELSLAQTQAALAELSVRKNNTQASLKIEKVNLTLATRERDRLRTLAKQGTLSKSSADNAERATLNARSVVQNLKNTLALIPTQQQSLQVTVKLAERNLSFTTITAPFNIRVANLAIEADQYASKGQNLFVGDSVDRVEVVAQVAMSALRHLFIGLPEIKDEVQLNDNLPAYTGFKPTIYLDLGTHTAQWKAQFVRFSDQIDSQTRTMGIVVAVDYPMRKIKAGERPPLSKGMLVKIKLQGHTQADRLIVPRTAIRDGHVYVVAKEPEKTTRRLRSRAVEVLFTQDQLSIIKSGLEVDEEVVISDLALGIEGLLLRPQIDAEVQAELLAAAGEGL